MTSPADTIREALAEDSIWPDDPEMWGGKRRAALAALTELEQQPADLRQRLEAALDRAEAAEADRDRLALERDEWQSHYHEARDEVGRLADTLREIADMHIVDDRRPPAWADVARAALDRHTTIDVPARPTEAEFDSLPILDPSALATPDTESAAPELKSDPDQSGASGEGNEPGTGAADTP